MENKLHSALFKLDLNPGSVRVRFVHVRTARRYIMRLSPDGSVRVTIPRGGSMVRAWEFAKKNLGWVQKQLARCPVDWGDGTLVFYRGLPIPLKIQEERNEEWAHLGELRFKVDIRRPIRPQVEHGLRTVAEPELIRRTIELAAKHQLEIRKVVVRSQRTRWGSCSSKRTICLNWRLIQTPESVRDYIIIHELMHLREMNHSAAFWRHVGAADPHYALAESWLKKHSRLLQ